MHLKKSSLPPRFVRHLRLGNCPLKAHDTADSSKFIGTE